MGKILTLVLFLLASNAWSASIVLRTDEWLPYTGSDRDNPGFITEIAIKILSRQGYEVDYAIVPWQRALSDTSSGAIDCVIAASESEVPGFFFTDESFGVFWDSFFVIKSSTWQFESIESLKGKRLGLTAGYATDGGPMDKYIKENTNTPAIQALAGNNVLEQNIKKLMAERVDTVLAATTVMTAKLREMGLSDRIVKAGHYGTPVLLYIACSPVKPSSSLYVKLLSEGILGMRENGELAQYYQSTMSLIGFNQINRFPTILF
jgi:polar amino acid transport system substrate-binding protein